MENNAPRDTTAELAVIGGILIDPDSYKEVEQLLKASDFFSSNHQAIYAAVEALSARNAAINLITVSRELDDNEKLKAIGGVSELQRIAAETPTSVMIKSYAEIVQRTSIQRKIIGAASIIAQIGYNTTDPQLAMTEIEQLFVEIRANRVARDFYHIGEVLTTFTEKSLEEQPENETSDYIPSGFIDLDVVLGGFHRSDLIILAARPGMGKSSFAMNVAHNAALHFGARVGLFELEMSKEQLAQRLVAAESRVDSVRLKIDQLSEAEGEHVKHTVQRLANLEIYIDDNGTTTIDQIRAKARRLHAERKLDLIVIDYLQLINGAGEGNRVMEVSAISRALKGLARELNVPILALSQLSRAVETRAPHVPILSDLRESGSIEQDADVVMFIYREDQYFTSEEFEKRHPNVPYPRNVADLIIAKHRNGPTGTAKLVFMEGLTKFENLV